MSNKLIIVVTGSRAYPTELGPYIRVRQMLGRLIQESHATRVEVWHGACPHQDDRTRSIDWVAHETLETIQWSRMSSAGVRIPVTITENKFPADWTHGKSAGPMRNARMVDAAAVMKARGAEVVVAAFPHPTKPSTGTRGCVELARKAGLRVVEDK